MKQVVTVAGYHIVILVDCKRHKIHHKFLLDHLAENEVYVYILNTNVTYLLNINICNTNNYTNK